MKRALIVDDNPQNLYYLQALLGGNGYATETAGNGAEALEQARRGPPDVLVSDLLMPVMDGYTLLRNWMADERLRSIPFVVYTATYTEPADERLALDMGASAFIRKPAEPAELLARLRAVESLPATRHPVPSTGGGIDDAGLLAAYSETLIRKLEKRTRELEQANQALERDNAERRGVEESLRISEARMRAIVDHEPECVMTLGRDGTLVDINPAGLRMLEVGRIEDLRGKAVAHLVHPAHRDSFEHLHAAAAAGRFGQLQFRIVGPGGTERWTDTHATPLPDADGTIALVLMVARDITERLVLEDQLRQAQRLEALGQLTGGVAHDFNNLLTVILGNAELLMQDLRDAEPRQLVEMISAAAQSGAELTRRLLAFARKQALDPRPTSVNALVISMETLLRRALGAHVEIRLKCAQGLRDAFIDASQLENALLNLCINARDAMPGGGRLTIESGNVQLDEGYAAMHPETRPGEYVMLAISDSGTGISPEHLKRVFEPFFTTKDKGKGTGLGLAMVYGFIKQSGGHVNLYSEPGHGTTVKLYLPVVTEGAPARPAAGARNALQGGDEHILLVEDDELVRRYASGQLSGLGYRVIEAVDGAEALRIINGTESIDLLFTDVVMPGMSGRQLADQARRLRPGLRVLFTSGYSENAIVHHGRLDPDVHLLSKPYGRADLARHVREALAAPLPGNDATA